MGVAGCWQQMEKSPSPQQLRNFEQHEFFSEIELIEDFQTDNEQEVALRGQIDGGWAWVMAIMATLTGIATWGANGAFGVFLDYYLLNSYFKGANEFDFALIGGIVMFCAQALLPLVLLTYNLFGGTANICFGIVLQSLGYFLAAEATKTWQLYCTQGLLVGLSFAFISLPATLMLPSYFDKYLATCMGIAALGLGIGALTFSLLVQKMILRTGDQKWALRMLGFVCLFAAGLPALLMRPRKGTQVFKPARERFLSTNLKREIGVIFDSRVFKLYPIVVLLIWFSLCLVSYTILLYSLAHYARLVGLTPHQGSVLTAILLAGQVVGRPLMGFIGDKIGRCTFAMGALLLNCIFMLCWWINATSYGSMVAFSLCIGLVIGVGTTMAQSLVLAVLGNPEIGPAAWAGMNIFVGIFTLVAEVIALALVDYHSTKPFLHAQLFAGFIFLGCFLLQCVVREFLVRKALRTKEVTFLGVLKRVFYPIKV